MSRAARQRRVLAEAVYRQVQLVLAVNVCVYAHPHFLQTFGIQDASLPSAQTNPPPWLRRSEASHGPCPPPPPQPRHHPQRRHVHSALPPAVVPQFLLSPGALLAQCRSLLLPEVKADLVDKLLLQTASTDPRDVPSLTIDRIRASEAYDRSKMAQRLRTLQATHRNLAGGHDILDLCKETVVGQVYTQMHLLPVSRLRPVMVKGAPHCAFNVTFAGEAALGQAGPYRAFFADVCRELMERSG
jgi:hypothetical protein